MTKQPNVILFMPEDMGLGDMHAHGNPIVHTPNLDRFASESVAWDRFYTSPVCAPTRAGWMTGRDAFRTGVTDVFGDACEMATDELTLAEALKSAGYATGLFGKWHLGEAPERQPHRRGFDEFLGCLGVGLGKVGYFDPVLNHNGRDEQRRGYCMDIFTDAAIEFMQRHKEEPFLLCLPSNLLHTPLIAPEDEMARYADTDLSEETRTLYAMTSNVDANFGRLRTALAELGLEDDTFIIVTSDHGPCSGSKPLDRYNPEPGLHGLKGTIYDRGIRVFCYMRWPNGFDAGPSPVPFGAYIDLMPTILDACGVSPRGGHPMTGRTLMPLLRDRTADWPDRCFVTQWDSGPQPRRGHAFCVINQRWKLAQPCGMDDPRQQHIRDRYRQMCIQQGRGERSIDGPPRHELYDLQHDPGEYHDLAGDHPDVVAQLRAHYDAWFDDATTRYKR